MIPREAKRKKIKLTKLRLPARASLWYCAAGVLSRAIAFFMTPIFTRLLTGGEYGVYPLYLGWLSLFSVIGTLDLGGTALLHALARFEKDRRDVIKSAFVCLLFTSGIFLLFYAVFIDGISKISGLGIGLLLLIPVEMVSEAVNSLYCTSERFKYSYKKVFLANALPALFTPLLSLLLIPVSGGDGRCIGAGAVAAITALALVLYGKLTSGRVKKHVVIYLLKTSLAVLAHTVSGTLLLNADKLLIGRRLGESAVARYSVAHSLGLVLTFFTVGIFGALRPWILRKLALRESDTVEKVVESLLTVGAILTAALTAVVPEAFSFLAPKEYSDAIPSVYPLALAVIPMFLTHFTRTVSIGERGAWKLSLASIGAAGLNVGLNALLLMKFSYISSSIAFLVSYSILALISAFIARKSGAVGKRMGKIFILAALLVGIFFLLRDFLLLRILLLGALIPRLITEGKRLWGFVQEKNSKN